MSQPKQQSDAPVLIDLAVERDKRAHDLKEKRLKAVREAFEKALPLKKPGKKPKTKPKKR